MGVFSEMQNDGRPEATRKTQQAGGQMALRAAASSDCNVRLDMFVSRDCRFLRCQTVPMMRRKQEELWELRSAANATAILDGIAS